MPDSRPMRSDHNDDKFEEHLLDLHQCAGQIQHLALLITQKGKLSRDRFNDLKAYVERMDLILRRLP